MYKLLVLDMDGTLLNEHQEITPATVKAIKKVIEKGIHVVIATGRTKQGIDPYLKTLGLEGHEHYAIVCSGALVMTIDNQILWTSPLTQEDFQLIYDLKNTLGIDINIYTSNSILIEKDNYYSIFDALANNLPLQQVDLTSLSQDTPIVKVTLINEDITMAKDFNRIFPNMKVKMPPMVAKPHYQKKLFQSFDMFDNYIMKRFNVSKATPYNIEFSSKNANKGLGVEKIAKRLNIKPSEIICIGDSDNDRQMIQYAGLGIAMGNAFPEIKKIADVVTASNMEDGVAKAIEQYIFTD